MHRILLASLLALTLATTAHARGVRLEIDGSDVGIGQGVLVAKDQSGLLWSVRLGLVGDTTGIISGIVTQLDNPTGDPVFLECQVIAATGEVPTGSFTVNCWGAPRCDAGDCPDWVSLGQRELPMAFFLP